MILGFRKTLLVSLAFGFSGMAFSETITLEQVIRETCAKSDSAKMMNETRIRSKAVVRERWANALPVVSSSIRAARAYGLGYGAQNAGGSSSVPDFTDTVATHAYVTGSLLKLFSLLATPAEISQYSTNIQVTQPIYTFGKIGTAIKVASEYDSSVISSQSQSLQQLQLLALDAYYQALLSQMTLDIAGRSYQRKKELGEFLSRNLALGSGSKAQVLATTADLRSQWAEIIIDREAASAARMRLSSLMGRPLTDTSQLDTSGTIPELASIAMPVAEDAVGAAQQKRGDLHALEILSRATRGGASIYSALYLPTIAGMASFGTTGFEPKDMVDWDKRTWSVGVGLNWTLFDGFANASVAAQYRSDARKLMQVHEAMLKVTEIQVRTGLAEWAAADTSLVAAQEGLAAATEGYDLTNTNFKEGSGQFVDVIDADNRLRQAEMGRVLARYRYIRSRAALLVAMGQDIIKLEDK